MNSKNKKGGLLLSENTLLLLDRMTDEEALTFIRVIRNYHKDGTLPPRDTERLVSISFDVFRADYDESQIKYLDKVKRMEEVNKNRRNTKSSRNRATSCENGTTTHDIAPNTIQYITLQNNTSNKESKAKKDVSLPLTLSPEEEEFVKWMGDNYPHLCQMEKPLTMRQYNDLEAKGYQTDEINAKLSAMENDKTVPRKKRSVYEVLKKWLENE